MLLGSYRKIEAADPDIFAATLAAVLSRYPDDVIIAVTDPVNGPRLGWKFPPDAPEIRDACERAMRPRYDAAAREAEHKRVAAQLEETRQWRAAQAAVRAEDIAKLKACADELRALPDPIGRDLAREASAKRRLEEALDRMREEHCSIETPSGIRISPALKALMDRQVAEDAQHAAEADAQARRT